MASRILPEEDMTNYVGLAIGFKESNFPAFILIFLDHTTPTQYIYVTQTI
jgi:hypothetical protein